MDHNKLWKILKEMGIPDHLICLLRNLYAGQEATVRTAHRLPATYANFLVINGAVLCPTYAQPDLDAEALRLIKEAFPDRDIVGIDCRSIIKQHGSLHCCTMQFPLI